MARPDLSWQDSALCREVGPELFTGDLNTGEDVRAAKRICGQCPARRDCLDAALREEAGKPSTARAGIRGGASPRQRARMKQQQHAA